MRRERTIAAVVALVAAVLLAAPVASAASGTHLFTKNATDQGYGGVGGKSHTTSPPANQGVAGQEHTASSKPLATTGQSGTLPFTGAQLGVFLALGLALVFGGLLLHRSGSSRSGA